MAVGEAAANAEHEIGIEEDAVARECVALDADLAYHTTVIAASHNPLFRQLNATIHAPFRVALSYTLLLPASVELELEEYRKLTEAIEQRNPLAARRSAEEIVGFAMLAVEQVIRDQENGKTTTNPGRVKKPRGIHIARSRPEP